MTKPIVVRIIGDADFSKANDAIGKFGKIAGGLALGAGAAVAGGLAAGFGEALNLEKTKDKLAAQLGLTGEAAERAGKIAGDLYADAYGDSLDEVASAVQSAFAAFPNEPPEVIEELTAQALDMGVAFEGSADGYVALAKQLESQNVVAGPQEALDFLTTAFQQLPGEMQGPLTDAIDEYGTFLTALGFSTEDTFDVLTQAAGKGEFALDKTGDALKEFSIRATDMSTASVDAFNLVGLDAQAMGEQVLAGGDQAKNAFDQIVDGLLGIDDPVAQANAAIALFGTPLEDLGTDQIPEFLGSLDEMTGSFDDVAGAAGRMGDELNDNLATRLEGIKRRGLQGLAKVAEATVVPALELLLDVGERVRPVFEQVGDALSTAADIFRTAFSYFSGDSDVAGQFMENLGTPLGGFVSEVARVAVELGSVFGQIGSAIGGLFGGDGEGGGLGSAIDGILSALRPLIAAFGDFLVVLQTGEGFEDFNQTAVQIAQAVRDFASVLIDDVIPAVLAFYGALIDAFEEIAPKVGPILAQLVDIVTSAVELIVVVVERTVEVLTFVWENFGDEIVSLLRIAFDLVVGIIGGALDIVAGLIKTITAVMRGDWSAAWEGIKQILSGAWQVIHTIIRAAWNLVKLSFVTGASAVLSALRSGLGRVVDAFAGLPGRIRSAVSGLFQPIYDKFKSVIDRIKSLWRSLDFKIPKVSIPGLGSVGGGSVSGLVKSLPFFASGNVATTPTLGVFGEYAGARSNPEITTPERLMADTFRGVLAEQGRGGPAIVIQHLEVRDGRDFEATIERMQMRSMAVAS